jgi:Fe-S-cluster containining protein
MNKLVQIGDFNFRFECQPDCTNCCTQDGDVFLNPEDVTRIARHLNVSESEFGARYCESDGDLRLTIPDGNQCHFLAGGGCSIHEVKPLQCRTFPFWPEFVKAKRTWKNLGKLCPGIGVGAIVERARVREDAQACLDAFPDL